MASPYEIALMRRIMSTASPDEWYCSPCRDKRSGAKCDVCGSNEPKKSHVSPASAPSTLSPSAASREQQQQHKPPAPPGYAQLPQGGWFCASCNARRDPSGACNVCGARNPALGVIAPSTGARSQQSSMSLPPPPALPPPQSSSAATTTTMTTRNNNNNNNHHHHPPPPPSAVAHGMPLPQFYTSAPIVAPPPSSGGAGHFRNHHQMHHHHHHYDQQQQPYNMQSGGGGFFLHHPQHSHYPGPPPYPPLRGNHNLDADVEREIMRNAKPGDWYCPHCRDVKFARKGQCECGTMKPIVCALGPGVLKRGDWICPCSPSRCVFARRDTCDRCGKARVDAEGEILAASTVACSGDGDAHRGMVMMNSRPGDWYCTQCKEIKWASKRQCRCGEMRPAAVGESSAGRRDRVD